MKEEETHHTLPAEVKVRVGENQDETLKENCEDDPMPLPENDANEAICPVEPQVLPSIKYECKCQYTWTSRRTNVCFRTKHTHEFYCVFADLDHTADVQ